MLITGAEWERFHLHNLPVLAREKRKFHPSDCCPFYVFLFFHLFSFSPIPLNFVPTLFWIVLE